MVPTFRVRRPGEPVPVRQLLLADHQAAMLADIRRLLVHATALAGVVLAATYPFDRTWTVSLSHACLATGAAALVVALAEAGFRRRRERLARGLAGDDEA